MAAPKDKAPTITFGGRVWPVGALGWEVLAKLFPDVTSIYTGDPETRIRTRLRVIVTALSEQATEEDLRALPTDLAEITIASDAIGVVSGMIRLGEYVQGLEKTTGKPSKAGTISSPMSAPAPDGHSPQWHINQRDELYLQAVRTYADEIEGPPLPGDFVIYKVGHCHAHGAIVIAWPDIIHAVMGRGVVYGNGLDEPFARVLLRDRDPLFFSVFTPARVAQRLAEGLG